jgi:hypothetical protein
VLWQSYMHVPRTSTGTNTTTPAPSGPIRVLKPSALACERNADGADRFVVYLSMLFLARRGTTVVFVGYGGECTELARQRNKRPLGTRRLLSPRKGDSDKVRERQNPGIV